MRSWPIQNKEDLDKTKGNLAEWVEIMFLGTFLPTSVICGYTRFFEIFILLQK